ncbi:hypothetical protein EG68_04704 [Paragonimus skrjabini miyazakii]|uniref:TM2 domain-containing protein n=1 Tax=Paragonimus skrjabini miyazakii TaxID=59628 RepID=A0A8S9YT64_9TREM|nr:hypothetical protein EG68_04704 [Paragonimus skrjabini miyazakii]
MSHEAAFPKRRPLGSVENLPTFSSPIATSSTIISPSAAHHETTCENEIANELRGLKIDMTHKLKNNYSQRFCTIIVDQCERMWTILKLALLVISLHYPGTSSTAQQSGKPLDVVREETNANHFGLDTSLAITDKSNGSSLLSMEGAEYLKRSVKFVRALCPYMFYQCSELPAYCLSCDFNSSCIYGLKTTVVCQPLEGVFCNLGTDTSHPNSTVHVSTPEVQPPDSLSGRTNYSVKREFVCRYCYQVEDKDVICLGRAKCRQPLVPRSFYETLCEPRPYTLCLGRRIFRRMLPCNWSSGKSYITALLLSLFLGGFGADRFYLGMWIEGLGKLFSFGGLGIWSVVDFILLLAGYLKPPGDAVYW